MSLDRFVTLRVARPPVAPERDLVPILMYHRVAAEPEAGPAHRRLCTSPARFAQHLAWLADAGWTATTVGAALAANGHRTCAITFDDGFREVLTEAMPALADRRFRATIYLPTASIGHSRRRFQGHDCLTWREVRMLHRQGYEFGSHTVTHPHLERLPWSAIDRELEESKRRIELELEAPVDGFSCPYAFPSANDPFARGLALALRDFGYTHGVTTAIGRAHRRDDRYRLRRLPMSEADDEELFRAKLEGRYDWMAEPQSWSKRLRALLAPVATPPRTSPPCPTPST